MNRYPISQDPRYSKELRHLMDIRQLSLREFGVDYDE